MERYLGHCADFWGEGEVESGEIVEFCERVQGEVTQIAEGAAVVGDSWEF